MDEQKQKLIERIRQAQNILVTVSANPSVDQLSAAIGLTLALNKLNKHGTAVFSGQVPSTIEFLKPEETLEKNTDSLRDFIIALDKTKADKLRYKVEDQVVRIFITPYRTSLSENDLEFSQGDFNVDVVVALGVTEQQDLDAAITAHGRILHDAAVASVSTTGQGSLGTINWVDPNASSLSEMMASLAEGLDKKAIDGQIATAFLTGIVANTERFSNEKTTPKTMTISAALMAAGANQQLIATELNTPLAAPSILPSTESEEATEVGDTPPADSPREPGMLEISHEAEAAELPRPPLAPEPKQPQIHVDENGQLLVEPEGPLPDISKVRGVTSDGQPTEAGKSEVRHERLIEPPKLGDVDLTANITPEELDPSTEELTLPAVHSPLLSHNETVLTPPSEPPAASKPTEPPMPQAPSFQPAPPSWQPPQPPMPPVPATPPATLPPLPPVSATPPSTLPQPTVSAPSAAPGAGQPADNTHVQISDDGTLSTVPAPASGPAPSSSVDDARNAVQAALNGAAGANANAPLDPIAALNAQPLGPDLHAAPQPPVPPAAPVVPNTGFSEPTPGNTPADDTLDMPLPSNPFGPGQQVTQPTPPSPFPGNPPQPGAPGGQTPPPPVPPPMFPPLQ